MNSESAAAPVVPAAAPVAAEAHKPCANCGAPMYGPFCYACGQPEKGMVRHLASVMSDVADTIFNVDSRIFRSIAPLYFRPGFLTTEYFVGRRTRYVTPFRLFFFLCVISFFAIQIALNLNDAKFDLLKIAQNRGNIEQALTEAELDKNLQDALSRLEDARKVPEIPAADAAELDQVIANLRQQADQRRAWIKRKQEAQAKGEPPPRDPNEDTDDLSFDGTPWDPSRHPIAVGWLPAFANAKLNEMAMRARDNIKAARNDPRHLVAGIFSVLPQTLFVLMPLFAVLLKIVYIFKRRLYMEHLMVALHSHAFIFLSLLLIALLSLLKSAVGAGGLRPLVSLAEAAVWTWLPIYLFLMQKRVYRQGWFMTTFKYGLIGISYLILLCFGLAGALVATLTLA
ncbi:DUF3667 domain-containing protein [Dokdonella ginsengisoli]|uniref:DUF3667 domain-containing protein n=1 Tax=Dokdonella ginsengisoli TaxID=363846 RepID=A0ABV9QR35_9GAMM